MYLERFGIKLTIGAFVSFFTSYSDLFGVLMLFMVIDYITGLCKGYITKQLSSKTGGIGIVKKFLIMCVIVVAHYIQMISGFDGIELLTLYFFIANECLSILENCAECNLPLPSKLVNALKQLKGED